MESPMILIVGLIQYFILSIIVGGIIFNISFQLKKHVIFSGISSIMVYLIRSIFLTLSLPIGISTLINLVLTVVIFKYVFSNELEDKFTDSKWKTSIISSVLIFIITIVNEILTLQPTLNLLKTDVQSVLKDTTLHFQATMIQNLGLLVIMLVVYIVKKYLVKRGESLIDN